jgi:multiple sugar transport system substrate-binding protein
MWLPFLWSGGGELTNAQSAAKSKDVNLVSENATKALQFWRDLIEDGSACCLYLKRGMR